MKFKTKELTGETLNAAVLIATNSLGDHIFTGDDGYGGEGFGYYDYDDVFIPVSFTIDWKLAGPIIESNDIGVMRCDDEWGVDEDGYCTNKRLPVWAAFDERRYLSVNYGSEGDCYGDNYTVDIDEVTKGSTPLEAAMRHYVLLTLGQEVEIEDSLAGLLIQSTTVKG